MTVSFNTKELSYYEAKVIKKFIQKSVCPNLNLNKIENIVFI